MSIGSKRRNIKPPYLIETHNDIGIFLHFLAHHGPQTGEIALQFAVYIFYNICKRMDGARGRYLERFMQFWGIGANAVMPNHRV